MHADKLLTYSTGRNVADIKSSCIYQILKTATPMHPFSRPTIKIDQRIVDNSQKFLPYWSDSTFKCAFGRHVYIFCYPVPRAEPNHRNLFSVLTRSWARSLLLCVWLRQGRFKTEIARYKVAMLQDCFMFKMKVSGLFADLIGRIWNTLGTLLTNNLQRA